MDGKDVFDDMRKDMREEAKNAIKGKKTESGLKKEGPTPEEANYIRLEFKQADKYLTKLFDSLKESDFEIKIHNNDNTDESSENSEINTCFLYNFYKNYKKYCNDKIKANEDYPKLYSYYIDRVCSNKKNAMNETVIELCAHIFPSGKPSTEKSRVIDKLNLFLQRSYVYDENEIKDELEDDATHTKFIENLRKEIRKEYKEMHKEMPISKINEKNIRMANIRRIYADIENRFSYLIKEERYKKMFSEVRVFNMPIAGKNIIVNPQELEYKSVTYDNAIQFAEIPFKKVMRKGSSMHNGDVILMFDDFIAEMCKYDSKQAILVYPGNCMIPCGGTDQGIETAETPFCLSSSISYALNGISSLYPLENYSIYMIPSIYYIKNHLKDYALLEAEMAKTFSVFNLPPPYRPQTNIPEQDTTVMDDRLYSVSALMKNEEKIRTRIKFLYMLAHFLNYSIVIWNDWGIEDFWLPAHHVARIMLSMAHENKKYFKKIIFAINKKYIYEIYKKVNETNR